ncbi:MAG: methionyl-tRNA formyltransferase [Firmicutes bacterium]|nr:methionyl-tRNA formyltransferase [Candidatus Caballimonas caccae]
MRIVYLGTPDFAVKPLENLINNGENVVAVITNKDKPVGRKQVLTACPVKQFAISKNIPVYSYDKIRVEGVEDLKALKPDLMITCAFGQILSKEILDIPSLYTLNIHASILPKYMGASPIHFAILNGENKTGVTIMKTDEGIDTGDMLISKEVDIVDNETMGELFEKLSTVGADLIIEALELVKKGKANFIKQDDEKATFSKVIKKEMAKIDWAKKNYEIINQIRAFNPSPVAFTILNGEPFKIYSAVLDEREGNVGEVIENDKELVIGTGYKSISLKKVQKAGGKPLDILDFLRGNMIEKGFVFNND